MEMSPRFRGVILFSLLGFVIALDPMNYHPFSTSDDRPFIHLHAQKIEIPTNAENRDTSHFKHMLSSQHPQTNSHTQWLVHVKSPITAHSRERLNAVIAPFTLGAYVPHNTFVVVGPSYEHDQGEFFHRLLSAPSVLHVQEFEPSFKMTSNMWSHVNQHETHYRNQQQQVQEQGSKSSSAKLVKDVLFQSLETTTSNPTSSSFLSSLPSPVSSTGQKYYKDDSQYIYLRGIVGREFLDVDHVASSDFLTTAVLSTVSDCRLCTLVKNWRRILSSSSSASSDSSSSSSSFSTSSLQTRKHEMDDFYSDLKMDFTIESETGDSLEIRVDSAHAAHALHWLANRREIHWLERVPLYYLQNRYARDIIQSDSSNHTIWDHGLHGEGEIIAIGDTGIDHDLCFFYDPTQSVATGPTANFQHRKIVRYSTFADHGDDEGGHGTHVAGSLAGEVLIYDDASRDAYDKLSPYNGMANKAKMAFYDFKENSKDDLRVPPQIEEKFFNDAYTISNARIFSNSWGSPDGQYTSFSRDTDHFLHEKEDVLAVFAAGNYGMDGYYTISSPGVAKNVLTVGASLSTSASFAEQSGAITITAPMSIAGDYQVSPAAFGLNFHFKPLSDATVVKADPADGCGIIRNNGAVRGNVAIVHRGQCRFTEKVRNLQNAGAIFVLVANNVDQDTIIMGAGEGEKIDDLKIPSVMINKRIGDFIFGSSQIVKMSSPTEYTDPHLNQRILADFSSRGPTFDGRMKPDVVAPGQMITSARSDGSSTTHNCAPTDLESLQGTSMATPITAGAAALVRQYLREGWYPTGTKQARDENPTPSGALLKAMMVHGTVPVDGTLSDSGKHQPGPTMVRALPPPSVFQGYGRFQLDHILKFDNPASSKLVPALYTMAVKIHQTGDFLSYSFHVKSMPSQPIPFFKVTLAWMDPAPDLSTPFLLVNNLDLIVYNQKNGDVWLGNQIMIPDAKGNHFMTLDAVNNVEKITLDSNSLDPTGVNLTVVVRATSLPVTDQLFGLVVTGTFDSYWESTAMETAVLCPHDCGGVTHGTCEADGTCTCLANWVGADCTQESTILSPDVSQTVHWTATGSVASDGWTYHHFEVTDAALDEGLAIIMTRTSSLGDPDLYVSYATYPTMRSSDYSSTECEPCGTPSKPTVSKIVIPRDQVRTGVYRIGVHGYCCASAQYALEVTSHVEPPPAPKWFRYVWIAAAVALFVAGSAAYLFVRNRAQAARPDGYMPQRDQPASAAAGAASSRMPSGAPGYVLGSSGSGASSASNVALTARPATVPTAANPSVSGPGEGIVQPGGAGGWSRLPTADDTA